MTTHRHRTKRGLCALMATAVLAGCSGTLPTDPLPQAGLPVDVQPRQDVQRVLPRPEADASITEIVRGFLRSNVGFAEDDDVARDFLTAALASEWVPTSNVLVLDGNPEITTVEPGVVSVTARVSGRIDATGRLTELPAGSTTTETFRLSPIDGQWRISAFPEDFGLWLSRSDLDQAFRSSTVLYLNPTLGLFVPDVRWLAEGEGLPTSLARAQLAPVPSHLEGAVVTGGAGDGRLTVAAVPVDPETQVATVNLQGAGISEDAERVAALRAQLAHSLLALGGIRGVDLRLAGRSLDPGGTVTASTDLGYSDVRRSVDRALLRVQDRLVVIDPTQYDLRNASADLAADLPTVPISWTGLAASSSLDSLAAVSVDGTELWRWHDGEESVNPGVGDDLTHPTFDPHGLIWVAGEARGGEAARLWFVDSTDVDAVARPLDVPDLDPSERVRAFRVSPDGTRALLVVGPDGEEDRGRLLVAGIVRDAAGQPTALAPPVPAAPTLTSVTAAHWGSATEVVVTGRRAVDESPLGFRVPLGGWLRPLGERRGLVEVLAVPTGEGYSPVARTEDGRFHTTEGSSGWYDARNGDELVIPGS
ncbi:LpqB family beta-propeller domain-containing protein [Ornithinimicrobium cerasi]|uniref:Lipoprotein LpqB beta-propeller domain-containing protein n=1 Tax=Ornithinimicrobium cerasi TaxID=2248773 RepID=A0A285VEE2_9MICO|nr:LpqB family beta-propeller domain-containing protein [Ornithinimicrobium cerasi]SOC52472.1 Lipoprotein LpqB beta-propeller domain-containing protein [Ornithinimicrobium cerasi]